MADGLKTDRLDVQSGGVWALGCEDKADQYGNAYTWFRPQNYAADLQLQRTPVTGQAFMGWAPNTVGPVLKGVRWPPEPGTDRKVTEWSWAFAAEVDASNAPEDGGTTTSASLSLQVRAAYQGSAKGWVLSDSSTDKLGALQVWAPYSLSYPKGYPGAVVAGSDLGSMQALFVPAGGVLVAPYFHGKAALGSTVFELQADDSLDPVRNAKIQSQWRVAETPRTSPPIQAVLGSAGKHFLALQLGSPREDFPGLGFYAEDRPGAVAAPGAKPPQVLSPLSRRASGPLHPGFGKADQHNLIEIPPDTNDDGDEASAGGLHTNAYWVDEALRVSGPMLFENLFPKDVKEFAVKANVHLSWDPSVPHPFIGGPRLGKWRWWTTVPVYSPPPPGLTTDPTAEGGLTTNPGLEGGLKTSPAADSNLGTDPLQDSTYTSPPGTGDVGQQTFTSPPGTGDVGQPDSPFGTGTDQDPISTTPFGLQFLEPLTPAGRQPIVTAWPATKTYVASWMQFAVPALLGRPSDQNATPVLVVDPATGESRGQGPPLENNPLPDPSALGAIDQGTPIVGQLVWVGARDTKNETWSYAQRPNGSPAYVGGVANGSLWVLPGNVSVNDVFQGKVTSSPATTYLAASPWAGIAWGTPIQGGGVASGFITQISSDGSKINISQTDSGGNVTSTSQLWPASGGSSLSPCFYGNGKDGAITFDGSSTITLFDGNTIVPSSSIYTLPEDIFPSSMTVNMGVTVKTAGNRIVCQGTLTNNGTISNNGNNAPTAPLSGNATTQGSLGGVGRRGALGRSTPNNGSSDGAGSNTGYLGGAGGTGGNAGGNTGGAGGSATFTGTTMLPYSMPFAAFSTWLSVGSISFVINFGNGGNSGGGGALAAGASNSLSGGGGGGGGPMNITAKTIVNNGTIQSKGGNGGNAFAGGDGIAAGGGGGGGGGWVNINTNSYSGNAVDVSGGGFGNGGNGGSTGFVGSSGTVVTLC